jgi:hypothetical protein
MKFMCVIKNIQLGEYCDSLVIFVRNIVENLEGISQERMSNARTDYIS